MGKGRALCLAIGFALQLISNFPKTLIPIRTYLVALTYLASCTRVTAAIQINCGGYSSIRSTRFSREGPVSGFAPRGTDFQNTITSGGSMKRILLLLSAVALLTGGCAQKPAAKRS